MKIAILNLLFCCGVVLIVSPTIIKFLKRIKFGQNILIYVEKHKEKSGTPTMGGVIFIFSTLVGYLIFYNKNNILSTVSLLCFVFFGLLGFLDDFIKIKYKQNEGLKPYQKIIGQLGISIIISIFVYCSNLVGSEVYLPFINKTLDLGVFIIPFVVFVYLALVNSVNLIDGLDGLCAGVSGVAVFVMSIILMIVSQSFTGVYLEEIKNLNILSLGLVGGLLGFLCFNSYPAKVFMGDTGSLALGGYIASLFVLTKNPFLILIVGFLFVLTALSVVIQVFVYKLTKKRVFKMAPLHHHFEQNTHEVKVVSFYIIVSSVIGLLTITFYLRG